MRLYSKVELLFRDGQFIFKLAILTSKMARKHHPGVLIGKNFVSILRLCVNV